jgi:hypothetical protein
MGVRRGPIIKMSGAHTFCFSFTSISDSTETTRFSWSKSTKAPHFRWATVLSNEIVGIWSQSTKNFNPGRIEKKVIKQLVIKNLAVKSYLSAHGKSVIGTLKNWTCDNHGGLLDLTMTKLSRNDRQLVSIDKTFLVGVCVWVEDELKV